MALKPKVIISLDVETDGPTVSANSCLQLGFAVVDLVATVPPPRPTQPSGMMRLKSAPAALQSSSRPKLPNYLLELREWSLLPQDGKREDPGTMTWWADTTEKQAILAYIRKNGRPAELVIPEVFQWIDSVKERYEIEAYVCMPTAFDWQWIRGLAYEQGMDMGKIPHTARCLSTLFSTARQLYGIEKKDIGDCPDFEYEHRADVDAARQGWLYIRLWMLMRRAKAMSEGNQDFDWGGRKRRRGD